MIHFISFPFFVDGTEEGIKKRRRDDEDEEKVCQPDG